MKNSVLTHSASETFELGKKFASTLQRSDVVALYGDLGSGKTQFAKGVCLGLGVHHHVVSPSFTILNEYLEGKYPVYHFDFYRLRSLAELAEFGFEEYLFGDGVCLLEWANIVDSILPMNRHDVTLEMGERQNQRIIHFAKALSL
ncbi:MAG: tRNA (adenosine(37)-N6)-threonylcarbamoyltransferase complex ATPase subunit type 1 TsaE [Bacteroidota bacterium]